MYIYKIVNKLCRVVGCINIEVAEVQTSKCIILWHVSKARNFFQIFSRTVFFNKISRPGNSYQHQLSQVKI